MHRPVRPLLSEVVGFHYEDVQACWMCRDAQACQSLIPVVWFLKVINYTTCVHARTKCYLLLLLSSNGSLADSLYIFVENDYRESKVVHSLELFYDRSSQLPICLPVMIDLHEYEERFPWPWPRPESTPALGGACGRGHVVHGIESWWI